MKFSSKGEEAAFWKQVFFEHTKHGCKPTEATGYADEALRALRERTTQQ